MNDQAKLERLLKILLFLNCKYGRSIQDIAVHFGISSRTVYRYIETIRCAGYVVERIEDGGSHYYYINKEEPHYRDISELLHFSEEEAYILSKAIHSIDHENIFKNNLLKKLYSLYDNERITTPIIKKEHSNIIHKLTQAINNKKQVILLDYQSSHGNTIRNRSVEPFGYTVNFVAVWCYDVEDQKNKLFKTSRIRDVELTEKGWKNESGHRQGNQDIFRISNYEWIPVRLQMSLLAYNLLLEEYPLAEKYITRQNDNTYMLETEVAGFYGIARFIMGLPGETKILEPQALKDFIKDKIKILDL